MQCLRAILSSVVCPAVQYFSTLSHKRHDFRKKKLLNINFVFWFSLQLLSETFLILRRNERDVIKNIYWLSCKVFVIPVQFTWSVNILDIFWKILKYQISWRCVQWESDGRTKRHDEAIVTFNNFAKTLKILWTDRLIEINCDIGEFYE
jgi:hypothetical protein